MRILKSDTPTLPQKESIFKLWNTAYPSSITYVFMAQLDSYLNNLSEPEHYFLVNDQDEVAAWALTFTREDERWFAIIVDEAYRGHGSGTWLLDQIKLDAAVLNGWVIDNNDYLKPDGTAYMSPLSFYMKNDFEVLPHIRLEMPQMSAVKIRWSRL